MAILTTKSDSKKKLDYGDITDAAAGEKSRRKYFL